MIKHKLDRLEQAISYMSDVAKLSFGLCILNDSHAESIIYSGAGALSIKCPIDKIDLDDVKILRFMGFVYSDITGCWRKEVDG